MLTYAIGDIHGRLDLLNKAITHIENDVKDYSSPYRIIFLGDYQDHGPDSKGVIERLMELQRNNPNVIFLYGNHEDIFVKYVRGYKAYSDHMFVANGGDATLKSYARADAPVMPEGMQEFYNEWCKEEWAAHNDKRFLAYAEFLRSVVDEDTMERHAEWIRKLPKFFDDGQRFFVHAGIDPAYPLDEQLESELLWTRSLNFLAATREEMGYYIVHGHTPEIAKWPNKKYNIPEVNEARANLDTAAFISGVLTIGVFNDVQEAPIKTVAIDVGFSAGEWRVK